MTCPKGCGEMTAGASTSKDVGKTTITTTPYRCTKCGYTTTETVSTPKQG